MEGKTDGTTRTSGVASCPSRVPLQFAQQLLQASNDLRRDIPASCWVQPHVTSYIILCLQHSTKPRRRQSLVPSTCFKRFVCAGGEHRTAWMAPPFRIFSMRSVAACQCSEPKKLACDNIWPFLFVSICFCPCSTAATSLCHFFHQDASMESMAFHGRRRRLGEFTLFGLGFALHRRSGFIEGLLGRICRLVRLTGLWRGSRTSHLETSSY